MHSGLPPWTIRGPDDASLSLSLAIWVSHTSRCSKPKTLGSQSSTCFFSATLGLSLSLACNYNTQLFPHSLTARARTAFGFHFLAFASRVYRATLMWCAQLLGYVYILQHSSFWRNQSQRFLSPARSFHFFITHTHTYFYTWHTHLLPLLATTWNVKFTAEPQIGYQNCVCNLVRCGAKMF